jgi:hypothetical protein
MTSAQQDGQQGVRHGTPAATSAARLAALRGNCMGAAVLLIIEFGLGIAVNLYVTVPAGRSFLPAVFGSVTLAAHAIVAIALLGAATGALVRAIRSRRAVVFTAAGLAAVLAAGIAGASFVSNASGGVSLAMALATAAAMFCYLAAVFSLR